MQCILRVAQCQMKSNLWSETTTGTGSHNIQKETFLLMVKNYRLFTEEHLSVLYTRRYRFCSRIRINLSSVLETELLIIIWFVF